MKDMRKSLGQAIVFLRKIERFLRYHFSPRNLVRKRHISGTLAETVDMYAVVLRSLSHPFLPTYRRRRKGSVQVQAT